MSLAYPVREYISTRRDVARLEAERDRVEAERLRVEEEQRRVLDPNWTKRAARERLHLCDPGAKCYLVPKAKQNEGPVAAKQDTAAPPWYETLWESVVAVDTARQPDSGGPSGSQ
ncbi:septum formation initiator family protein [Nonomuraea sp. NPDC050310]